MEVIIKINSIMAKNMINAYSKQKQYVKADIGNKQLKDKVEISEDAKYLSKINNDNENINLDKVNEIKQKIKEGTYKVDAGSIAKGMLKNIRGE